MENHLVCPECGNCDKELIALVDDVRLQCKECDATFLII